jgi:hypothetical protein
MGHIREYLADAIIGLTAQVILWKSISNFSGLCSAVNPMKQAAKIKTPHTFVKGCLNYLLIKL